jgi:hypothetical protein
MIFQKDAHLKETKQNGNLNFKLCDLCFNAEPLQACITFSRLGCSSRKILAE